MNKPPLDSANDIEKIVRNLLLASKCWGKFPTPVDRITEFAELQIERGVDLSKLEPSFFTKNFAFVKQALSKVLGLVDLRQKKVYLDQSQNPSRRNFVQLHEVGHKACTWQSDLQGFLDDEETLDPDTNDLFEREASFFASSALFQLDYFDHESGKLPLSIKSAQVLGQKFGGSNHAAIRRYVERSPKRCALLVLHKPEVNGEYHVRIRDYFQSTAFTADFGQIVWPDVRCGLDFIFVQEIKRGRRLHEAGRIALMTGAGESVSFNYHFFNSSHNTFVLILPEGEKIKSRVVIIPK